MEIETHFLFRHATFQMVKNNIKQFWTSYTIILPAAFLADSSSGIVTNFYEKNNFQMSFEEVCHLLLAEENLREHLA